MLELVRKTFMNDGLVFLDVTLPTTLITILSVHFHPRGRVQVIRSETYANVVVSRLIMTQGRLRDRLFVTWLHGMLHAWSTDIGSTAALWSHVSRRTVAEY